VTRSFIGGNVSRLVGLSLSIASRDLCFALLSDTYGILVHSCYISDGQGENVEVVRRQRVASEIIDCPRIDHLC